MTRFFYWWIIFTLICFGSFVLYFVGTFDKVNESDVTKLSFLIYALFIFFTIRTGIFTYQACKSGQSILDIENLSSKQEVSWFVSDIELTIGMLGTVLGFIYMLGISFSEIDPSNIAKMRLALKTMGVGMSTALYTTAAGLVCSLILKIQLFNLNRQFEEYEDS